MEVEDNERALIALSFPVEGGSKNIPVRGVMWVFIFFLNLLRCPLGFLDEMFESRFKRASTQPN